MPVRKSPQTPKASSKSKKAYPWKVGGPIPPYGVPIRDAIARGNAQEMKAVAAGARKHLADVSAALAKLEASIKKARS